MVFHMVVNVSLIFIPYVDDVFIIIVGIRGGMAHELELFTGSEISNIAYAPCFSNNIRYYVVATIDFLLAYDASHLANLDTWEEELRWILMREHQI